MRHEMIERKPDPIPVMIFRDSLELGEHLALEILGKIARASAASKTFLLGCPGGRSLRTTYLSLGAGAARTGADLSRLVIVMMDDYVLEQDGRFVACPSDAHYSCARFGREEIREILNKGLPPAKQVAEANLWLPDPADPAAYDAKLKAAGGIDLFLLASGSSDGHVAFNKPNTLPDRLTHIVELADTTRQDNLGTFPQFKSLDEVPRHGVSVGLGTIAGLSRETALVIHGGGKQFAAQFLLQCRDFNGEWPVSIIFRCKGPHVYFDEAAVKDTLLAG